MTEKIMQSYHGAGRVAARFRAGGLWGHLVGGWKTWTSASSNRSIFGAALTVGAIGLVAKLANVGRDLMIAMCFGTGDAVDAFLVAYLIPSFAMMVVAGSFNAALIPTLIQVRTQQGLPAAQRLLSSVMLCNLGLLLAASVALLFFSKWLLALIGAGFSPEKLAHTQVLFYILIPCLLISGINITCSAVLNAEHKFALAAVVPLATPLLVVAALILKGNDWDIYAVAGATVGGLLIESFWLGLGLRRTGFHLLPGWFGLTAEMKQVINQYLPMVAGAALMGATVFVNQSMAAALSPGSVSALNYGGKAVSLLTGIGALALGTAVLPHFSRMVSEGQWDNIRHTLKTYLRLVILVTLPLLALLVIFSTPLVRLVFERGSFTAADTQLVSRVQQFAALQIPFYVLGILLVRLITAFKANHLLMWGAGLSIGLNVLLNLLLIRWLGVAGIALATSVVYAVSFVFLACALNHLIRKHASNPG